METSSSYGIVYVLTNPAMPGIVKIGKTSRSSMQERLNELYSTGVPVPFECAFAGKVEEERDVENAFHTAFGPYRVNRNREFFKIAPEQAIALLRLMVKEDVTPALQKEAGAVDADAGRAAQKLKKRRPNMNFYEMGIPEGSTLGFINSQDTACVVSERKVLFRGQECSLTGATKILLELEYSVAPGPHWQFKGESLQDIYEKTYDDF